MSRPGDSHASYGPPSDRDLKLVALAAAFGLGASAATLHAGLLTWSTGRAFFAASAVSAEAILAGAALESVLAIVGIAGALITLVWPRGGAGVMVTVALGCALSAAAGVVMAGRPLDLVASQRAWDATYVAEVVETGLACVVLAIAAALASGSGRQREQIQWYFDQAWTGRHGSG